MKEYNRANIPLAKILRKNMTPWERKLWYNFLRQYPVRFQRQKAIGNYIADFYCAKAKLIIELDGGGHHTLKQAAADEIRTKYFNSRGFSVLRISNLDVDRNFSGVCACIDQLAKSPSLSHLRQQLPRLREPQTAQALSQPPSDEGGGFAEGKDGGSDLTRLIKNFKRI